MSGKRITLDLFIPDSVYTAIPLATKLAFRDRVRAMKALAIKVGNEMTVSATIHTCYHDENPVKPCDPEQDI